MKKKSFAKVVAMLLAVILFAGGITAMPISTQAKYYTVPENVKWWAESKFGMFIHLGAYSYYGQGEWIMSEEGMSKKDYQDKIVSKFNPVNFDAKKIVSCAKGAGMKYLVITAKHHEGLAMWDTKVDSFKDYTGKKRFSITESTPFGKTKRDILMELKKECEAQGIKFGLYYSIIDWNHSSQSFGDNFTKMASATARTNYIRDMKAQLKELVDTYNPAIMWFDGDWTQRDGKPTLQEWWTKADGQELYKYMKQLNPKIIVNERVCRGFGLGDYACPENEIPTKAPSRLWESCFTLNGAWGYKKDNQTASDYLSTSTIIAYLDEIAEKGGNFLLNIGPAGDGSVPTLSQKRLASVGAWMKKYGESIYGTKGTPFNKLRKNAKYLLKDKTVYAHINGKSNWPTKTKKLKLVRWGKKKIQKISLMQNGKKLKYKLKGKYVYVKVPKKMPNKSDTVIVMEYK